MGDLADVRGALHRACASLSTRRKHHDAERHHGQVSRARTLLQRVAKLEAARAPQLSPIELAYGSFAAFEAEVLADIAAGKLDRDFPIEGLRKCHADGVWGQWQRGRNQLWEHTVR
ncbi:MAG: hypothetical protein ACK4OP_01350 [Gemmobacter sp.]